jgi:hypothetical protein
MHEAKNETKNARKQMNRISLNVLLLSNIDCNERRSNGILIDILSVRFSLYFDDDDVAFINAGLESVFFEFCC